jgi:hypothetical protein
MIFKVTTTAIQVNQAGGKLKAENGNTETRKIETKKKELRGKSKAEN